MKIFRNPAKSERIGDPAHPFVAVPSQEKKSAPALGRSSTVLQRQVANGLWLLCGGIAGGAAGAFLGHTLVILLHFYAGAPAALWLKGSHGPPFFDLALSTALFYGGLGAMLYAVPKRLLTSGGGEELSLVALHWPWRHEAIKGSVIGFGAAFIMVAAPMLAATRLFSWGENPADAQTLAWFYLVLGAYGLANAAASFALGFWLKENASIGRGLGAVAGISGAYVIQLAVRYLFPGFGAQREVISWLAPPSALYAGVLWGAMLALGVTVVSWEKIG